MRLFRIVALLGLGLALSGFTPLSSGAVDFANCSASGSSAQTLVRGRIYVMQVFDEETWVCFAASSSTCASGGRRFPAGFAAKVTVNGDMLSSSCRSAGATGDVEFTPVQ